MSGVSQHQSIPESQHAAWEQSLRPFYNFLLEHDLCDVPLDNEQVASNLADRLRRTMLRIRAECEVDDALDGSLGDGESFLRRLPIETLADRKPAAVRLILELRQYFETKANNALPSSLDAVVHSLDQFIRPPQVVSVMLQKAKRSTGSPTPLKFGTKDLTSEAETQHSVMDPMLAAELKGSLWHTTEDSFFDTYFPPVDDAPQPPTFPHSPTEDAVVKWFRQYYEEFRDYDTTQHDDVWVWQMSPSRALFHPDNLDRKIDFFLMSKSAPSNKPASDNKERARWEDVVVVGELKNRQTMGDLSRKMVLQISNYVRETFGTQPGRRFVHAFTILNEKMRCWLFTRSGGIASKSFELNSPDGLNIFRRVFVGYMRMNKHQLGLANFENKASVGNTMFYLSNPPLWPSNGIVTRGTTCWTAEYANEPGSEEPFVVKDSWRFVQRENEAVLLRDCKEAGVEGIAEYIAHEESFDNVPPSKPESVHQVLGTALLESAIHLDLDWKSKKRPSPYAAASSSAKRNKTSVDAAIANSTRQMAINSVPLRRSDQLRSGANAIRFGDRRRRGKVIPRNRNAMSPEPRTFPYLTHDIDEDQPDDEAIAAARASETHIPDRIHTRLVMSRGIRIEDCTEGLEYLLGMRDAIRGHYSLLTKGGILHRDISENNIMVPHSAAPRADNYHGFLIDLDHAQRISGDPSGAPERTGTYPFISIEGLEGPEDFVHTFYDDLQSFWFVFLMQCTWPEATETWFLPTNAASLAKVAIATDNSSFERFLRWFDGVMPDEAQRALRTAATYARNALWPNNSRVNRASLGNSAVRDTIYEGFIKAFDRAVYMLDPQSALFRDVWEREDAL